MNSINGLHITENKILIADSSLDKVLIAPGDHCVLAVDGVKVSASTEINANNDVTWYSAHNPDPPFDITVSADNLHVQLTVYANSHHKWTAALELQKGTWVVNCSQGPDPSHPVTVQDVLQQYRKQQLHATVDRSAVEQALKEQAAKPIVIAQGQPAVAGKDGWVEAHFPLDEEVPFEEAGDKLNYREKRRIPIVRAKELMATIHPPIAGQPGKDVWGRLIAPKPAREVNCRLKQNVTEEDGKVYAKITGRPSMTQGVSPVLDIAPVYTVPGDVDLTFGHMRFEGDVIILGNIMETMKVTASQRIVVHGGVYDAELVAGGSVHIDQTVRKSKVSAGQRGMLARQVQQPLQQLHKQVLAAENARKLLENEAKKKKRAVQTADILFQLLNNYYPDILKQAKTVLHTFETSKGFLPNEFASLQENLERLLFESTFQLRLSTWQSIVKELSSCLEETIATCLQAETLTLQTADISSLEANGDIVFTGKGSTHSHITASERILFTKPNASCRGGSLTAGQRIVAEHLGSLSGSKTRCRAGERIAAKTIQHCDIQIDGPPLYVEQMANIEYYKDDNQTLSRHWK